VADVSVGSRRRLLAALALVAALAPAALRAEPSETLEVLVFPDGHVEVGGRRLDDAGLEAAARAHATAVGPARARATIAADRRVVYARVVAVMDALRRGGIEQISMLVAPEGS
jgi:biopolymer transport protein ExbD